MGAGEGLLPYNYNHYLAGLLYGASDPRNWF